MAPDEPTLELRFYSDFIWPFCYIAERSSLVRLESEFDIRVDWRGFELHPETPRGGIELSRLHPDRPDGMRDYIRKFAASLGVYDMKHPGIMPNTRRALAMAEFARDRGKLNEFRSLVMDAHWRDGENIEDSTVLRNVASASGLDPENAISAADDPVYLKRVGETRLEYKQEGVGGIPTFVFGLEKVEGCQPYEVLAAAALRASARLK
jgi:predicted DsbA family dithiol-disulfide isomerase